MVLRSRLCKEATPFAYVCSYHALYKTYPMYMVSYKGACIVCLPLDIERLKRFVQCLSKSPPHEGILSDCVFMLHVFLFLTVTVSADVLKMNYLTYKLYYPVYRLLHLERQTTITNHVRHQEE